MIKKLKQTFIVATAITMPYLAMAQSGIVPPRPAGLPDVAGGQANLRDWILAIIRLYLLPLAGVIAVLFIIIGGYQYLFSGANEELAKRGKQTLTNAVIGLVIIILSYVIIRIVSTTLGVT